MIKINLATKKQAETSDTKTKAGSIGDILARVNLSQINDIFPIRKLIVPLAVAIFANYMVENYIEEEMKKLQSSYEKVTIEGEKWKSDLEKFKVYDSVKVQLDADEIGIKNKLETIKKLLGTRTEAGKIIFSISNGLPSDLWLTELSFNHSTMNVKGGALEYNQISDFMKNLNDNALFTDVELKGSEQIQSKDFGVGETSFELIAKRR